MNQTAEIITGAKVQAPPHSNGTRNILILRQDDVKRNGFVHFFALHGYEVKTCLPIFSHYSGLNGYAPDAVLYSADIKDEDPIEVAEWASQKYPHKVAILLPEKGTSEMLIYLLETEGIVTCQYEDVGARYIHIIFEKMRKDQPRAPVTLANLDLTVDSTNHTVTVRGKCVTLTPIDFLLLAHMAAHPGAAFSRQQLLNLAFGVSYEGYERNVDPHINRLRMKIEEDPANPKIIKAVWGVGYKVAE